MGGGTALSYKQVAPLGLMETFECVVVRHYATTGRPAGADGNI